MDKSAILKNKLAFDKWLADDNDKGVWYRYMTDFILLDAPHWSLKGTYIFNDEWATIYKALAEGKEIQTKPEGQSQWQDCTKIKEHHGIERYRIKPSKYKVNDYIRLGKTDVGIIKHLDSESVKIKTSSYEQLGNIKDLDLEPWTPKDGEWCMKFYTTTHKTKQATVFKAGEIASNLYSEVIVPFIGTLPSELEEVTNVD